MEVNPVSLERALRQICEMTCGTTPPVIRVTALGPVTNCFFAASVPTQYRARVYRYLVDQLSFSIPGEEEPLILLRRQAAALLGHIVKSMETVA